MQSNQFVKKAKGPEASAGTCPDMTISVNEGGEIIVSQAATPPGSQVCVTAQSTYSGVCIRTGMTFENGNIANRGSCACAAFADNPGAPHLTANGVYKVGANAAGSGTAGTDYNIVAIDGSAVAFTKTGTVHVGS
jgi:hypothetical protein